MRERAIRLTCDALPTYTLLPLGAATMNRLGLFHERCSFVAVACYVLLVELFVYCDHYMLLHRGKHLSHHVHHEFRERHDVTVWTAFAFYPWDGLSQGMPILYAALIVPVTCNVVFGMILAVGLWTVYLHTDSFVLPWPLMGCDYHCVHHRYNWYNFGLFTVLWDSAFGTLRPAPRSSWYDSQTLQTRPKTTRRWG